MKRVLWPKESTPNIDFLYCSYPTFATCTLEAIYRNQLTYKLACIWNVGENRSIQRSTYAVTGRMYKLHRGSTRSHDCTRVSGAGVVLYKRSPESPNAPALMACHYFSSCNLWKHYLICIHDFSYKTAQFYYALFISCIILDAIKFPCH